MMAAANCAVAVAASWPNKVALFPLILRSYFNQSKSQISCGLVLHERKWKNPNDLVVAVIIFLSSYSFGRSCRPSESAAVLATDPRNDGSQ